VRASGPIFYYFEPVARVTSSKEEQKNVLDEDTKGYFVNKTGLGNSWTQCESYNVDISDLIYIKCIGHDKKGIFAPSPLNPMGINQERCRLRLPKTYFCYTYYTSDSHPLFHNKHLTIIF
jgi:hypothetical protein